MIIIQDFHLSFRRLIDNRYKNQQLRAIDRKKAERILVSSHE